MAGLTPYQWKKLSNTCLGLLFKNGLIKKKKEKRSMISEEEDEEEILSMMV